MPETASYYWPMKLAWVVLIRQVYVNDNELSLLVLVMILFPQLSHRFIYITELRLCVYMNVSIYVFAKENHSTFSSISVGLCVYVRVCACVNMYFVCVHIIVNVFVCINAYLQACMFL